MKVRSLIIAILTGVRAKSIVVANAYEWVIEHRWALPCLRQSILLLNRTIRQPPDTAIFVLISQPPEKPEQLINALKYLPSQSTIAIAGIDLAHWRGQLTILYHH